MARLPQVGGDSGDWGTILNEYLSVEHEADGTLKADGSLAGKADASHTHTQSDVTGLQDALDDKLDQATADGLYADTNHTHPQSDITGLETALDDRVTEAEVDALVEQALEDHTPGIELGYAERSTTFTSAANVDITGLSVTVTGQGRPVDVEFYCVGAHHTVSGTFVRADIKQDGTIIQSWFEVTSSTTIGRTCYAKKRTGVLTDGVNYTFTIGVFQGAGGTMTWSASASPDRKMTLSVVSR